MERTAYKKGISNDDLLRKLLKNLPPLPNVSPMASKSANVGNSKVTTLIDAEQIFIELSKEGYYDGVIFHRIIKDFMVQGGDPTGTGAGGPGYNFRDEFIQGIEFTKPGILAMANAGPNTNGSQFFITHVPTEWLNYKHSIFGEVVSSEDQDIVNKITQGDVMNEVIVSGDVEEFLVEVDSIVTEFNKALEGE